MKVTKNDITLDKEINTLDQFVLDFIKIIETHCNYVIISGYVSILFGRSRATEDVDMIIPHITQKQFNQLWGKLIEKFDCLNTSIKEEAYNYLTTKTAIRFAYKDNIIPNMELKIIKTQIDEEALKKRIKINIEKHTLYISPIELQIVFKEIVLKSDKDIEDALHLRTVFKDFISNEQLQYYNDRIQSFQ